MISQPSSVTSDEVLDPAAADSRQVEARLDGDDVADCEGVGRLGPQVRCLVDVEPDAVAEPVAVGIGEARRADRDARGSVDIRAEGARANRCEAVQLRLRNEPVGLLELGGEIACRERPRAVGAIAVDDASHVDRDERSLLDRHVGGIRMRP